MSKTSLSNSLPEYNFSCDICEKVAYSFIPRFDGFDERTWSHESEHRFALAMHSGFIGVAMKIRNELGLWQDNELTRHMNTHGIEHPHDKSHYLLLLIHRRMKALQHVAVTDRPKIGKSSR